VFTLLRLFSLVRLRCRRLIGFVALLTVLGVFHSLSAFLRLRCDSRWISLFASRYGVFGLDLRCDASLRCCVLPKFTRIFAFRVTTYVLPFTRFSGVARVSVFIRSRRLSLRLIYVCCLRVAPFGFHFATSFRLLIYFVFTFVCVFILPHLFWTPVPATSFARTRCHYPTLGLRHSLSFCLRVGRFNLSLRLLYLFDRSISFVDVLSRHHVAFHLHFRSRFRRLHTHFLVTFPSDTFVVSLTRTFVIVIVVFSFARLHV